MVIGAVDPNSGTRRARGLRRGEYPCRPIIRMSASIEDLLAQGQCGWPMNGPRRQMAAAHPAPPQQAGLIPRPSAAEPPRIVGKRGAGSNPGAPFSVALNRFCCRRSTLWRLRRRMAGGGIAPGPVKERRRLPLREKSRLAAGGHRRSLARGRHAGFHAGRHRAFPFDIERTWVVARAVPVFDQMSPCSSMK